MTTRRGNDRDVSQKAVIMLNSFDFEQINHVSDLRYLIYFILCVRVVYKKITLFEFEIDFGYFLSIAAKINTVVKKEIGPSL